MTRAISLPHIPSRLSGALRLALPVVWLVAGGVATLTAGKAEGQLRSELSLMTTERSASAERDAIATQPRGPEEIRFGISEAVYLLVTTPGARLDARVAGSTGLSWDLGHQWVRVYPPASPSSLPSPRVAPPPPARPGPRVLGVPVTEVGLAGTEVPGAAPSGAALIPAASPAAAPGETILSTHPAGAPIFAPGEPGIWVLDNLAGSRITVVTLVPATRIRGEYLNGYHLGIYPTAGSDPNDIYTPPTGFIEVTPESRDLRISEHLTIGQFLTKDQFEVWPKYVALDLRMIDKVELVVQELNAMGIRADHIYVMSGFRTPQYNGPGGDGRAALSRHMWGDAADMWIDNDGDGMMDDLNGDGDINFTDATIILRAVDRVEAKYPELIGGAGLYPESDAHGPYIHIDARGNHARW
ncbi:MAG: hypothetical protein LBG44_03650 [Gemmatimonadota bacterium]|nr:hypothetical protein [Gemmatimonadota bacterium]